MRLSNRRRAKSSSRLNRSLLIEHLEHRQVLTTLSGFVFEDTNANDQRDASDLGIGGVTVYIDANSNGRLDQNGFGIEPDSHAAGEILNNSSQVVFPSLAGTDNQPVGRVTALPASNAPTGDHVFGHSGSNVWDMQNRLRFDFTLNIGAVSIDLAGTGSVNAAVQMDAYNSEEQLLTSLAALNLQDGVFDQITISREQQQDIKYVVLHVISPDGEVHFDNLRLENAGDEVSTITSSDGSYSLYDLPEASFVLRQIVPDGYSQVVPEDSISTPVTDVATDLNFGNRTNRIRGRVFNDNGVTGIYEPDVDTGIAGAAVYLDANGNNAPDSRMIAIDPGSFLPGQALGHVSSDARLTVADASNTATSAIIIANDDPVVSMDGNIFTRDDDAAEWTSSERLRIDLDKLASQVELDFIAASDDGPEQGIMIAYSEANEAIATTTTQMLQKGQRQQMRISRPNFDISYVVAYTVDSNDPQGRLDDFEAVVIDEPVAFTDDNGFYEFKPLDAGDYRVAALPQSGQQITVPSSDDTVQQISVGEGEDEVDIDFGLQSDNAPPVVRADIANTVEEGPIPIGVLVNDFDPDGSINEGSIEITQDPMNGTAIVTANGFINYTPNENFNGTDTLIYTVRDDLAAVSNSGVVTINVTPVNDPPTVVNDVVGILPGATPQVSTIINVLANDTDVDGTIDRASLEVISQPANGTALVNQDTGTIIYTTTSLTDDSFSYVVSDDVGQASSPATVTISARQTGIAPVAQNDEFSTLEGTRIDLPITANDSDPDGTIQGNLISVVAPPGAGSLVVGDGIVTFVPVLGFVGTDTFSYQVRDNDMLASNTAQVTVNVSERDFPYQNPIDSLDVNPDGFIIPRDALIIINEINNRRFSDPVTGQILANPDPGSVPPAYYDVNGDGFIAALDVLRIINALNTASAEAPAAEAPEVELDASAQAAIAATFASNFDAFAESEEDETGRKRSSGSAHMHYPRPARA